MKSVGANYLFTADEICNIVAIRFVISPIRITPFSLVVFMFSPLRMQRWAVPFLAEQGFQERKIGKFQQYFSKTVARFMII